MRVISGTARGISLNAPEGMDTRPTTDRVKENLFNMIQHEIRGKTVLDLFSGSGALAIETLSRGAVEAVMVEPDKRCYTVISENLKRTRLESHARILRTTAEAGVQQLKREGKRFDLVLMDPPYRQGWVLATLTQLTEAEILQPDVLVVVEHEAVDPSPERIGRLVRVQEKKYGRTALSLYREATS